jgi:hypothetical protein
MKSTKISKTPSKVLQPKPIQDTAPSGVFQFQDNRPEAIIQQKTQELANEQTASKVIQPKANNTGLPNQLKSGIENLSGYSMDDVKVHYNSPKPAQLQAHAYAQGTDIHVASGQEKHLPHEAWHVVQQKQGRVKPTIQLKEKVNINDDVGLEKEADVMGGKAMQMKDNPLMNVKNNTFQFSSVRQLNKKSKKTEPVSKEEDNVVEFKTALKENFKNAIGNAGAKNIGNGGGGPGTNFIIPVHGTRHHIYPKSQLVDPAFIVSKAIIAYNNTMESDISGKAKSYGSSGQRSLIALGQTIGLNNDGTVNTMGNYYWNRGIHFYGVASDYRSDDPGSNPEPFKPASLSSEKFNRPKEFGSAMQSVKSNLTSIGSSGTIDAETLKDARTKYSAMNSSGHMTTSEIKGDDWTLSPKPATPIDFNSRWKFLSKSYALNRSGSNVYKSYHQSQLAPIENTSSNTLKTVFDNDNVNHNVLLLNVFGLRYIGGIAKNHVNNAIIAFNAAKSAIKPHLVYDNMVTCLAEIRLAKAALLPGAGGAIRQFDQAILDVTTAKENLTDDHKEDIHLSR